MRRLATSVLGLTLLVGGCRDTIGPLVPEVVASLPVAVDLSSVPEIALVRLTVSAPDMTGPVQHTLVIESGIAHGVVSITAGPERTFLLEAIDSRDIVRYRGAATTDVAPGTNPSLTIVMAIVAETGEVPIVALIGGHTVTLSSSAHTLYVGDSLRLEVVIRDQWDTPLAGALPFWSSATPGIATVDDQGKVQTLGVGVAHIVAAFGAAADTAVVTVEAIPPPPPSGQFVVYPNERVALIAGPQVVSGTSPWPFFDVNAITTGHRLGSSFTWSSDNNYYDQALVQYINYYRTGDEQFRTYARQIADTWYAGNYIKNGTAPTDERGFPPREVSLGGLMLRAMDGRPEMWDWMYQYVNYMYWLWVERFNGRTDEVENAYRDPGYATLYAAYLAKVLPDAYPRVGGGTVTDGAAKRADLLQRLERDAQGYFTATQRSDGSWRWTSSEEGIYQTMPMVFMGMWLEALIAIDQVSTNPAVHAKLRPAIVNFATHLHTSGVYRLNDGVIGADGSPMGVKYRSAWYFYHGGTTSNPTAYASGGGTHATNQPIPYSDMIREQRQLNPLHLHVFGYAYKVTGDAKFIGWGDEWFASTFGKSGGPLSDGWYGLCDWNAKSYNQCYRSAGRYLAWRAGHP